MVREKNLEPVGPRTSRCVVRRLMTKQLPCRLHSAFKALILLVLHRAEQRGMR
jgi:hypothetical protein